MENIKCPRCGSEQISANKKGYTLTTGVIGMNRILLTCMKCGKQFRPGKDLQSNQDKRVKAQENAAKQREAMKKPGFWIFFGVIMILIIVGFKSCFTTISNNEAAPTYPTKTAASAPSPELEKYYAIESNDTRGQIVNLFVYVSDATKIPAINESLKGQYNPNKDNLFSVYYFTKKGIGPTYLQKINKLSDKEADKLFKYFVANYTFNPNTGFDKLNYPHQSE